MTDLEHEIAEDCYLVDLFRNTGYQTICSYIEHNAKKFIDLINQLIVEGEDLERLKYYNMAIVTFLCGIELLIRFLLLKPLLGGMFLDEDWIFFIEENKLFCNRTDEEQNLLLKILKKYGLDIEKIEINESKKLWTELKIIVKTRNNIVHNGLKALPEDVKKAFLCLESLINYVLKPIYQKLKKNLGERLDNDILDGWKL